MSIAEEARGNIASAYAIPISGYWREAVFVLLTPVAEEAREIVELTCADSIGKPWQQRMPILLMSNTEEARTVLVGGASTLYSRSDWTLRGSRLAQQHLECDECQTSNAQAGDDSSQGCGDRNETSEIALQ